MRENLQTIRIENSCSFISGKKQQQQSIRQPTTNFQLKQAEILTYHPRDVRWEPRILHSIVRISYISLSLNSTKMEPTSKVCVTSTRCTNVLPTVHRKWIFRGCLYGGTSTDCCKLIFSDDVTNWSERLRDLHYIAANSWRWRTHFATWWRSWYRETDRGESEERWLGVSRFQVDSANCRAGPSNCLRGMYSLFMHSQQSYIQT